MRIIYTSHAKKRMKERGISEWEVNYTLEFPNHIRKSFNNRLIAVGELNNKRIEIIFIRKDNYIS